MKSLFVYVVESKVIHYHYCGTRLTATIYYQSGAIQICGHNIAKGMLLGHMAAENFFQEVVAFTPDQQATQWGTA